MAEYDEFYKDKNDYFRYNDNIYDREKGLYDILMTEAYNKFGVCMIYYVSTYNTSYDKIFHEDNNRRYVRKFNIMGFYELPEEEEIWSKFGVEGLDNFKLFVSKRHFSTASRDYGKYSPYIPKVGDILRSRYNDMFYEIVDVGEEEEMFLNKKHSWSFTVRTFKDTNIALSAATSATMTTLSAYTNQEGINDIFNISAAVDEEKTDVLYNPPSTEESPDSVWGEW